MKVCILAPEFLPPLGGVGSYTVELVKNLSQDSDLDIHVVTPKRGENYTTQRVLNFFDEKITLHNISSARDAFFYNLKFQLGLLRNFQKLNKIEKFDLIHSANLVHMPDIFLKFRKNGTPSLATIHSSIGSQLTVNGNGDTGEIKIRNRAPSEFFSSLFHFYIRLMEHQYLKKTEHFIAVSHWIKETILNGTNGNKRYDHAKIQVVHNGIDLKRFSPQNNGEFPGLTEDKIKILYIGRLLAMKGLHTLIDSMKILKEQKTGKDVHFIFAGPGNLAQWEKVLRKEKIPEENYSLLGYVPYEKINFLYNKADIFVLPSFSESCPITILEAMASGVPVIASDVGGIPEIIKDGETGLLTSPGNPRELAGKISLLIQDKQLGKKLSLRGRELMERKFSSQLMTEKTKKVYGEIVEKN